MAKNEKLLWKSFKNANEIWRNFSLPHNLLFETLWATSSIFDQVQLKKTLCSRMRTFCARQPRHRARPPSTTSASWRRTFRISTKSWRTSSFRECPEPRETRSSGMWVAKPSKLLCEFWLVKSKNKPFTTMHIDATLCGWLVRNISEAIWL